LLLRGSSGWPRDVEVASVVLLFAGEVERREVREIAGLVVDRGKLKEMGTEEDKDNFGEDVLDAGMSRAGVFATGETEFEFEVVGPLAVGVGVEIGAEVGVGVTRVGIEVVGVARGVTTARETTEEATEGVAAGTTATGALLGVSSKGTGEGDGEGAVKGIGEGDGEGAVKGTGEGEGDGEGVEEASGGGAASCAGCS
jgi:hypothetical protein